MPHRKKMPKRGKSRVREGASSNSSKKREEWGISGATSTGYRTGVITNRTKKARPKVR